MADEPRRSGRATKGQHTKNDESHEPEPLKKSKGKGRAVKKVQVEEVEQEEEDEEKDDDEEAIIRCICNNQDTDGTVMVCCDQCDAWQHNVCMGISEVEELLPEHYFCELCRPEDHSDLLNAVDEGETPEQVAHRRREDSKRKGKKGKMPKKGKAAARQSKGPELKSEESTNPATTTPNKRKSITPAVESKRRASTASNTQTKSQRRSSGVATKGSGETAAKKRKVSASASSAQEPSEDVDPTVLVNSVAELKDPVRQGGVTRLLKRIAQRVKTVTSKGTFRIPDGETPNSLGEYFALHVEHALFMKYAAQTMEYGGVYKDQMVSIYFNINENDELLLSLLNGTLSPEELAVMKSNDMAKPELKAKIAAMQEQSDKQNMLINEEGPRIRRTHKGEEVVGDQYDNVSSEAISAPLAPRRRSSTSSVGSPHSKYSGGAALSPMAPNSQPVLARHSSSNFDINNVWSNVQSPVVERRVSHPAQYSEPVQTAVEEDPDVDRLLNDNEPDTHLAGHHANTKEIVWKGGFDMVDGQKIGHLSTFDAQAHHIGGSNLANRAPLSSVFPPTINIIGYMPAAEADDYICSTAPSRNMDVTVLELTTQRDDPTSQMEFKKLYDILLRKKRCVVMDNGTHFPSLRDAYVFALEPGSGEMPQFLYRLADVDIEDPRPNPMIIAVFVLKWRNAGSVTATTAQGTASQDLPQNLPPVTGQYNLPQRAMSQSEYHTVNTLVPASMSPANNDPSMYRNAPMPGNPYAPPAPNPAFNPNSSMFQGQYGTYHQHQQQSHDGTQDPRTTRPGAPFLDDEQLRLARDILGPWFDAPVPQSIMLANAAKSFGDMRNSLEGIRRLVEKNPAAAESFEVLQMELANENGMSGAGDAPQ